MESGYNLAGMIMGWLPPVLIVAALIFLIMRVIKGPPSSYQKEYLVLLRRQVEALERIEHALTKN